MSHLMDADKDVPWQKCNKCQGEFPITAYYFDRDQQEPTGYRKTCKVCRKGEGKRLGDLELAETVSRVDKMALRLLEKAIGEIGRGSNIPHVGEVFEEMMQIMGGAKGYATRVALAIMSAPAGSNQQMKGLSIVKDFAIKATDTGAAKKPVDLLTDEELELELKKRESNFPRLTG